MELAKICNEISFDPTPNLKSSPVPILFISFNSNDDKCNYCGLEFSKTIYFDQKYCKNCFTRHIKYLTDSNVNVYLDIHISTNNTQCNEHEPRYSNFLTNNIQKWCAICSEILYFRQIINKLNYYIYKNYLDVDEYNQKTFDKSCNLCGKLLIHNFQNFNNYYYHHIYNIYNGICSYCYSISSGWTESKFIKKSIPVLYLPWWDPSYCCKICYKSLKIITGCQKLCSYCLVIYTGCRQQILFLALQISLNVGNAREDYQLLLTSRILILSVGIII